MASKCKLAPVSARSIPRLELQAAVLGVRLAEIICAASTIVLTRIVFWTDADNTITWLQSPKRRYTQYVGLRISEILAFSKADDWRWTPSEENPADIATKTNEKDRMSMWINGPGFLKKPEIYWPKRKKNIDQQQPLEILKVLHVNVASEKIHVVADPQRVGSWRKMVRATAQAKRFIAGRHRKRGELTSEELHNAEIDLHREAQLDFAEERRLITAEKQHTISKTSELHGTEMFIDEDGVMRLQGRNTQADLSFDAKHPILLPRRNLITKRILEHYHKSYLHENTQTTLNELRQRYLIKRCRTMINKVAHECQTCIVNRAKPIFPQMADHPIERLAFNRPSFTNVGVDYFGPMTTTTNGVKKKRWGVLFTCLTTRAIHLELAHSLTGKSCLRCVENFTTRRGFPQSMRSDNGTNFVWAAENCEDLLGRKLEWKFIPPAAPSQGGAWERLVKSVKRALYQLEIPEHMDDEQLLNFLIKAEALVNARPLTEIPIHPSEPALTPNHFLFGNSNAKPGNAEIETLEDTDTVYNRLLLDRAEQGRLLAHFWKRWSEEYLPLIAIRQKWKRKTEKLEVGDLVFICERAGWIRGVVEDVTIDPWTDQVREAEVRTARRTYRRPALNIAKIRISGCSTNNDAEIPTPESTSEQITGPMTRARKRKQEIQH